MSQKPKAKAEFTIRTHKRSLRFDDPGGIGRFDVLIPDECDYVDAAGGSILPRRFEVTTRNAETREPELRLGVEVVNGVPQCRLIESLDGRPLTATYVRGLSLWTIVATAATAIALRYDEEDTAWVAEMGLRADDAVPVATPALWGGREVQEALRERYRRRGGRGEGGGDRQELTLDYLRRVAAAYREAAGAGHGRAPAKYVAHRLGVPPSGVRRHIMRARECGLLDPAAERRPGEVKPKLIDDEEQGG